MHPQTFIKTHYDWEPNRREWHLHVKDVEQYPILPVIINRSSSLWFEPIQISCEERLASVEVQLQEMKQKYKHDMNDLAKTAMGGTDVD
jgi:hypothetical protein